MDREIEMFEHDREMVKDPRFGARLGDFAERSFRRDAATIVAILVKCDREKDAKRAAAKAREAWDDERLHAALDRALEGEVPRRRR